jgi:hypothetical protein
MAVPKLVVNVFYSHLDNQVYSKFPFRIKTAMVDPYMGNTIKTFFFTISETSIPGGCREGGLRKVLDG